MPNNLNDWINQDGDNTFRLNYNLDLNSIVFDIGGAEGIWFEKIYDKYQSNIYVFEPTNLINNSIEKFKLNEKIKIYQSAAFTYDGELTFGDPGPNLTSIYNKQNLVTLKCIDLKNFIKNNNFNKIDLIKINIEGAEYPLLLDLIKNNLISIFDNLQIQFHKEGVDNYEELYNEIQNNFLKTHKLTWRFPFVWENWEKK